MCTPLKLHAHTVLLKSLPEDWKSQENSVQWNFHWLHNSSCYTEVQAELSEPCVTTHAMCIVWDHFILQLMKKRNEMQSRLSDSVLALEKNTETKLFVAWQFHGQVTSLWFLFWVLWLWFQLHTGNRKPKSISHPLQWLRMNMLLSDHSHFKCSLIKTLLLIYSLQTEPKLIWHVFEGGKLEGKSQCFQW